ncbi:hypothetical protein EVAR_25318_1 [Eumeta japonica]|uniref:Uncharacterized protein n=1 Tax=Eumeta variegata TaxID=151549 RepID=A0A4C1VRM8_EUMVA|nr:hypothetical protein EVAR_25318_1 [Eumeta japonica]
MISPSRNEPKNAVQSKCNVMILIKEHNFPLTRSARARHAGTRAEAPHHSTLLAGVVKWFCPVFLSAAFDLSFSAQPEVSEMKISEKCFSGFVARCAKQFF